MINFIFLKRQNILLLTQICVNIIRSVWGELDALGVYFINIQLTFSLDCKHATVCGLIDALNVFNNNNKKV